MAAGKVGFTEDLAKAYKRVLKIPFSSSRKMLLTVSDVSGRATLCREAWLCLRARSSSASARALPISSSSKVPSSSLPVAREAITKDIKKQVLDVVDEYSSKALRVLAM